MLGQLHHEPMALYCIPNETNNRSDDTKNGGKKQCLLRRNFLISCNGNDIDDLIGGWAIDDYLAVLLVDE